MAHLKLQVENGLEVASLLSIVAVAREWWEAMYRLPAPSALTHVGWFIMLIVSFPGLHQASLQYCKKGGRGLRMRLIILMNLSVSLKKSYYYKMQGTITFKAITHEG